MGEDEGLHHVLLGDHAGPTLHHDDGITASGHNHVHVAGIAISHGRINDEPTVHPAHANAGHRSLKWIRRDGQRCGCPDKTQRVRVVVVVARKHSGDDLRLIEVSIGEERPDRPIYEAASEHLALRGTPLALEEATRDLARRKGLLNVVAGQGQETAVEGGFRSGLGGDQHHRIAILDDDRSTGHFGQLSSLQGERPTTQIHLYSFGHTVLLHLNGLQHTTRQRTAYTTWSVRLCNRCYGEKA